MDQCGASRVKEGLARYPVTSGKCAALARVVHAEGIKRDKTTKGRQITPSANMVAARFVVPKFDTDFVLEESTVTQPNGAAGQVLLRLGTNFEQDRSAEDRVRGGLSSVVTLAEWASSDAPVADLGVDDVTQPTHTAVQALRLLPRRGVKMVTIGGKLIARSKPVDIQPEHEKRFLEVVSENSTPSPFDKTDEIRAIDLDRGLVILGRKDRTPCFLPPEQLQELNEVGVTARVQGQLYRPFAGRSFVIAVEVTEIDSASGATLE